MAFGWLFKPPSTCRASSFPSISEGGHQIYQGPLASLVRYRTKGPRSRRYEAVHHTCEQLEFFSFYPVSFSRHKTATTPTTPHAAHPASPPNYSRAPLYHQASLASACARPGDPSRTQGQPVTRFCSPEPAPHASYALRGLLRVLTSARPLSRSRQPPHER